MKDTPPQDELKPHRIVRKFWRTLMRRPFIAIVLNEDGSITVYTKGIVGPIDHIRDALKDVG